MEFVYFLRRLPIVTRACKAIERFRIDIHLALQELQATPLQVDSRGGSRNHRHMLANQFPQIGFANPIVFESLIVVMFDFRQTLHSMPQYFYGFTAWRSVCLLTANDFRAPHHNNKSRTYAEIPYIVFLA
jgi:hypothetical protein